MGRLGRDSRRSSASEISLLSRSPGLPDLVFTANAALIYQRRADPLAFPPHAAAGRGAALRRLVQASTASPSSSCPEGRFFEGAGDALFCGETLIAGYRIRSDVQSQQWLGELLGCEVHSAGAGRSALLSPRHLLLPARRRAKRSGIPARSTTTAAAHWPSAFRQLIPVAAEEAQSFACNAVVVGKHVVTNTGCPQLARGLADRGYTPHETPLSEFVKAGGSAKCLTLRLDGEEAAAWKTHAA